MKMEMEQLRSLSAAATDKLRTDTLAAEAGESVAEFTKNPAPEDPKITLDPIETTFGKNAGKTGSIEEEKVEKKAKATKKEKVTKAVEASEEVTTATKKADTSEETPAAGSPEMVQAYQPNFKYKAGKEEKEVPEFLRAIVKDADSEKAVKELLEKGDGLDYIKTKHTELYNAFQDVSTKHSDLTQGLAEIGDTIRRKDFDTLFEVTKISPQDIMQWAVKKAQEAQLPPERQAEIAAARDAEKRAREYEAKSQSFASQLEQQAVATKRMELNWVMQQPSYKDFVTAFEAKVGQPGAFEQAVIQLGKQVWMTEGRDITAEEAVKAIVDHYKAFMGDVAAQAPTVPTQAAPVAAAASKKPPVIPNMQGDSTSPTKAPVKTLDQLRKLSKEAGARLETRNN
jgi:hypothetical protein